MTPAVIRPYEDGDAPGVAELLEESAPSIYRWKLRAMHGPGRDEPSRWRTKVAVGADGAVTLAHHSVHQGQYVLVVQVAPAHRRQGLGRALVTEGRRMRTAPLVITAQFLAADTAAAALLRAVGGRVVQTTPSFRLDPAAMVGWVRAQPTPPGVVLRDLAEVPAHDLAAAWRDLYVWQHEGWTAPPLSLPGLTRVAAATVEAADRSMSSGAWVDGRLAAFALVLRDPDGGMSVVTETMRRDEPGGVALVAAVTADCLRRLAGPGVRDVLLDGHVTDPHLDPVTRTFPPGVPADPLLVGRLPDL